MRPWTSTPQRKFNSVGQDVTEAGDYQELKANVEAYEKMCADLGLEPTATSDEIEAAKAKKAAEVEYESAKDFITEYEEKASNVGEPDPEPITAQETQDYNEAKAVVAAYEAAQAAQPPVAQPSGGSGASTSGSGY